jgi:DNA-binding cell septation regulator SpoVG
VVAAAAALACSMMRPLFAEEQTQAAGMKQEAKAPSKAPKEIVVTEVGSDEVDGKKMYYVVLNDIIKIAEIETSKIAGKTIIKYPMYVSKRSGRAYPQVKVVSKQANDAITSAIETGKASKPALLSPDIDFRISVFNPLRSASRKANVEVTFAEAVAVSCGVMETGAEPWIAWPSRKDEQTGQYIQQVFFKGNLKKKVDNAVLNKYKTYKIEGDTGEWK